LVSGTFSFFVSGVTSEAFSFFGVVGANMEQTSLVGFATSGAVVFAFDEA
jgi:hypothetical protein